MNASDNFANSTKIEAFLSDLQSCDVEKYRIIQRLRELVRNAHPDIKEDIKYGGIVFSLTGPCGGVFASKHHVSFEFSNGFMMKDPENLLEGSGRLRRHLKIRSVEEIDRKKTVFFVGQFTR